MALSIPRHPLLLDRERALLLVVDVQEKLAAVMPRREEVVARTRFMIETANVLGVPVVVTEQYRRGLGPTVEELQEAVQPAGAIEKMTFSCCGEAAPLGAIMAHEARDQVILVGMEAHVCVFQTALDLIELGRKPYVVTDAVCSRSGRDADTAFATLAANGAVVTTAESAAFQLLREAGTPEFKAVLKLLKSV